MIGYFSLLFVKQPINQEVTKPAFEGTRFRQNMFYVNDKESTRCSVSHDVKLYTVKLRSCLTYVYHSSYLG